MQLMKASAVQMHVRWVLSAYDGSGCAMAWALSAQADVNCFSSISALMASSAHAHENSSPSMSAMSMWHDAPSISDVNSSLR